MKYLTLAATISCLAMASVSHAGGLNDAALEPDVEFAEEDDDGGFILPIIIGIGGAAVVALALTGDSASGTPPPQN